MDKIRHLCQGRTFGITNKWKIVRPSVSAQDHPVLTAISVAYTMLYSSSRHMNQIFVNFDAPPHYLGLKEGHQNVRQFVTK